MSGAPKILDSSAAPDLGVDMPQPSAEKAKPSVRLFALALLFCVSLLSYLDRFALGVLLPGIAHDLRLSDAQLGFVTSGAFGLVYAFAGIPLGRLADRRSHRVVLGLSVLVWSSFTAVCGFAQGFAQLAIARICVGLGQAGVTGPANALIGELFEPRRRATATSVYALGLPAGIIASFLTGGLLIKLADWRTVLIAFAAPGVVLGPVLLRALPDPQRRHLEQIQPASMSTAQVLRSLLSSPPFLHTALGSALFTAIWLALLSWLPTFFLRSHQLKPDQTGLSLALTLGLSQILGLLFGGVISDRIARRDRRGYLWICSAASLLATPFLAAALLAGGSQVAMSLVFTGLAVGLLQGAPALTTIQSVGCASARAVSISAYLVIVNLIGGLGSQLVGLLSDWLSVSLGQKSLGVALLIGTSLAGPWSALHFLIATRGLTQRLGERDGPVRTAPA